ncbi:MAG: hypothetical protein ACXVBC_00465 [Bdellovibrionota bacterium]
MAFSTLAVVGLGGCGGNTVTAKTYSSSSNAGDFATWVIDPTKTPTAFSVNWTVTTTNGSVASVITASGTCTDADATYNVRVCTVGSGATATNGGTAPTAGSKYDLLELPGTAIVVHPESLAATPGSATDEILVGILQGPCTTVPAGTFIAFNTKPGNNAGTSNDSFLSLTKFTNGFSSSNHADIGLVTNGTSFTPLYSTGDVNGAQSLTVTCDPTTNIASALAGTDTYRSVITPSGLIVTDGPRGKGGQLQYQSTAAAGIADLASKTFVILSFSSSQTQLMSITFGAVSGTDGSISITAASAYTGTVPTGLVGMKISSASNTTFAGTTRWQFASTTSGNGCNGAGSCGTGNNLSYGGNPISSTYAQPGNFPGLFYTNQVTSGNDTPTVFGAFKDSNGKVMVMGSNASRNTIASPAGYYISGQFIGFQK